LTIDNQHLYLGFGQGWREVLRNDKIPLHRELFGYCLIIVLAGINFLECLLSEKASVFTQIVRSVLTVLVIYVINWLIYRWNGVEVLSLFYHPSGVPGWGLCFGTIVRLIMILVFFQYIDRISGYDWMRLKVVGVIPDFVIRGFGEN